MELSFERYDDGRWYVIMPEYEGNHEDLEMVEGADRMLDALCNVTHVVFGDHPERIYCRVIE